MACERLLIFVITLLLLQLQSCFSAKRPVVDLSKVNADFINCPCEKPQPRSVKVKTLIKGDANTYEPPFIILHRCGHSGSCKLDTEKCSASKKKPLRLEIKMVQGDEVKIIQVKVTNHTECSCLSENTPIK
ncbi:uncharacterized protein LOC143199098 [Rhynchophorus ferrugineus]|uniref:uncharacterized protein LOC143199098 n=1 Tax=Rhynchophorus ferrugineus TaxID=354439 RepID=UPI003FCC4EA8